VECGKFFTFLEENHLIAANPAITVKGARREEKEPGILYKDRGYAEAVK
jgi:site-specific recombinase XerD